MGTAERVRDIVEPLLASRSLELVDVELVGGQLRIIVDRDGGIDLDALSLATRVVSRALDEHDPIPDRYTLEVSSPGLERPLRTAVQFARAVGAQVSIKTFPGVEGERRVRGLLLGADDDGITVRLDNEIDNEIDKAIDKEIDKEIADEIAEEVDDDTGHDPDAPARRERRLRYREIERARTVFEWGPAPRPGQPKPARSSTGRSKQNQPKKKKKAESR